ncbi:MAG: tetraacyldisaccharide 4'-kinase [Holosporaceae bacterium]|jgi:tetraacyldisaccharide 4'-kinase|nr:tetraacyldisaccharide 4'-kinase [Holosporaceae bacterium]
MFFKTPNFWFSPPNSLLRCLLKPLSAIYSAVSHMNYEKQYKYKSPVAKTIAVGAITAGGSGKTVVVSSLCGILKAHRKKVAVLSRGYGRRSDYGIKNIIKVDRAIHSPEQVGDEPMLLAQVADVFVNEDRSMGAQFAEATGIYDFFLLDDGIAQKDIKPDLKFVVIDSLQGFGNGEILPLGPNRFNFERIKHDINAAIILTHQKAIDLSLLEAQIPDSVPIIHGRIQQNFYHINDNNNFIAFCGIGYPPKFFASLSEKLSLVDTISFPDHYPYTEDDALSLIDRAKFLGARLITTEKDLVRIPLRFHHLIDVVPVYVIWNDVSQIAAYLELAVNKETAP